MNRVWIIILLFVSGYASGQDKYNYMNYNQLTEVTGTEYVIASIEHQGKMEVKSQYMLFINTQNGHAKQIDFPADSYIRQISQIKLDSLGINKIMVIARTVNLDNDRGIDWNDPQQMIILSTDGQERTQVTDNDFFLHAWVINHNTGAIVITGYYDTNPNGKYDKKDKNGMLIFDLKTMNVIRKIE
ncbi:MAG: hypothetical protein K9G61_02535 [Bacteroidales bacterium]|nr:hypothetical protein [Bacteroidales bacterium]